MGRTRIVTAVALLVVIGLVVVGVFTGALASLARSGLRAAGLEERASSSSPPSASAAPVPSGPAGSATGSSTPSPSARLPKPVLAPAEQTARPKAAAVAARLAAVKVKDAAGSYSGEVRDVGTGTVLFAHDARKGYIPASTMKLLTSAAALSALGPDQTFATSVVSPAAGRIVLVGGGDPYLARTTDPDAFPERASLTALARATARKLKAAGTTRVSLRYDASRFSGPAWNPRWPDLYRDQVTPTSALWVDEGRLGAGSPGPRTRDPAGDAGRAFAAALRKQGVAVSSVARTSGTSASAPLAQVRSMPLERIVEQTLMSSDNDAAEVLLRQAALGAGRKGSTAEGIRVVRAQLVRLGVWDAGMRIDDGSGLARETRVPADALTKVLRLAAEDSQPDLRPLITGLPVAGVEGSLRIRFFDDASLAGRGVVRGKTGTLRKVHALAGFVRTRDGSLLVYAFLVNNPKNEYAARVWLDRVTTALSRCGCR